MRTSLGSLLLFTALTLQTACSGTPSSAADVSGSWTGTYADTKSGVTGPLAASFSQENGSLSGTLTISTGWLCSVASQGNVSGSVDGTQVQASASFGVATALSFTGNVTGNTMSGTYQITSGVCAGGTGSFSLSH
ncbi:MAG TPA: hypothetical protein VMI75_22675 [Polyangiaceae bacterium]|nr:hypothetical protein [Polyangiaceae bacterium]